MADELIMTPSRPYLIRALYEWITDNGMTPQILVDANAPDVEVPSGYVQNGKIILNISMTAVHNLDIGDSFIHFRARFNGAEQEILVPVAAVLAIYARETSAGMMFQEEEQTNDTASAANSGNENADNPGTAAPHLRVIK